MAQMELDEIFYAALTSDSSVTAIVPKERIKSTCFEVSPEKNDNPPSPYIIVTYDGFQNQNTTTDDLWEGDEDRVQVSVEVAAVKPNDVKGIIRLVRKSIQTYMTNLYEDRQKTPQLESLSSDGIAWDWLKPCYYQRLTYQCTTQSDIDDEQES